MTEQMLIDIMQEAFKVALSLAGPVLLGALCTGMCVSVFQAVTSIQEQTLVLVPKMLMVLITITICFSWMLGTIMQFTRMMIMNIPEFIR